MIGNGQPSGGIGEWQHGVLAIPDSQGCEYFLFHTLQSPGPSLPVLVRPEGPSVPSLCVSTSTVNATSSL